MMSTPAKRCASTSARRTISGHREFDPSPASQGNTGFGTQFDQFTGPAIEFASFAFRNFESGNTVSYVVHYTSGLPDAPVTVNMTGSTITQSFGTDGREIAYVEFTGGAAADGRIDLVSITVDHEGPIAGADVNKFVFISDGEPNGGGAFADEVTAIEAGGVWQIEAVGINVSANNLNTLDTVEGEDTSSTAATNIDTAEDLESVIGELTGAANVFTEAGNDDISGAGGNDLIFGDVVKTDALAAAQGLSTAANSGWQVFSLLESGQGIDTGWDRADTLAYIAANHFLLSAEAPRTGGHDEISGGLGNDIIYAQEGNDIISYNWGDGRDLIHGGSNVGGKDLFKLNIVGAGGPVYIETVAEYQARTGQTYVLNSQWSIGLAAGMILVSNGAGQIQAELHEIEEIEVTGGSGTDTLVIDGSFTGTSLSPNTIVFNAGDGADTFDLTGRQSGHRVISDGGDGADQVLLDFAYASGPITAITSNGAGHVAITRGSITDEFTNYESFTFTGGVTLTYDQLVNDTPAIDLIAGGAQDTIAQTAAFTEGGGAILVLPSIDVSDLDGATLTGATVTLTNAQAGDLLTVNGATNGTIGGVTFSVSGSVVTFSGTASHAAYEAALQQLQFDNLGDAPNTTSRSFTVQVNDGGISNNTATATATVTVAGVNDAPTITAPNDGNPAAVNVAENSTAVTDIDATDPDGPTLTYSIVGGADAAKFQINASSGVLTFIAAQNFEAPADAGYDQRLRRGGAGIGRQRWSIRRPSPSTVTNVNEVVAGRRYRPVELRRRRLSRSRNGRCC